MDPTHRSLASFVDLDPKQSVLEGFGLVFDTIDCHRS